MEKLANDNFWNPKPIHELAKTQGIDGPQSLDILTGAGAELWENDADFDKFLDSINQRKRGASAA